MNDSTEKLISELAQKLGTTAEHLWAVLIRQAPISGAFNIICWLLLLVVIVLGWKTIRRKRARPQPTDEDNYPRPEWSSDDAFLASGIVFGLAVILILWILAAGSTTLAAFFNPEYWALKQLLP